VNGQLELPRPEGTGASTQRHPRQADTHAVPGGEPLTIPTSKATASQFAVAWARRGVPVDVVKRGRFWVVMSA
jgi:hypothetical protein